MRARKYDVWLVSRINVELAKIHYLIDFFKKFQSCILQESFNLDAFFIEASAHMFSDHIGSKLLTERVRRFAEFARSPPFGEVS